MAKYKPYNYDQSLLMPICLKDQLIPGTIEFAIHHLVDTRLDLSLLDSRFNNDETGRPAYDPRVLLKIVLVAYAHGIVHSRKIEQACRENIVFVALTCGQVLDHTTIASFVSSMKEEIRPLFWDILLAW
jgi:transposase